jgi:PAS domain S-box-containing protein
MEIQAFDFLGLGQGIADHALLQALPVAVYTTDEAGRITFYNEAAARLWGWQPALGEDRWCGSWRLYWPDGTPLPHDECPMAVTLKENRPVRGAEAIAERPDGTQIPFIPYPTPLVDAEGRLIGAINVLVDITERKQAERALCQRERELHEAQRIARMGHWRLDLRLDLGNPGAASGRLATMRLEWSAGTHLLMGTSGAGYAPRLKDVLRRVHPDDRRLLIHAFRDCLQSGKTSQWEFRVRNDDGREWVAWIEGCCETSRCGRVVALFGICQDVTEQRRMQATLREACEAAQAADRAKSTFLACMSHELRTPLNAIIGFSDLLQTELFGPLGSDQYLEYAADISRSGNHLLELVNDLLDMARIEAGVVVLQEEAIDIPMLIREAVNLASGMVSPGMHKIDIRLREPTSLLIADRRRLRQVLINLIGNAIKFTPSGGRIEIAVGEEEAGRVPITVTDTGIGIAPDKISGLGQPFSQIEDVASRRFDGSGMGLFITKALVERHGGDLRIASWPGRGTTVTVSLPSDRFLPVFAHNAFLLRA